jgi:hypothetical protein
MSLAMKGKQGKMVGGWVRRCVVGGVLAGWAFAPTMSDAADPAQPRLAKMCALVSRDEIRSTLGVSSVGELSMSGGAFDVYCKYERPNSLGIRFYTGSNLESYTMKRKSMESMKPKDLTGVGDKAFVTSVGSSFPSFSVFTIKGDTEVVVSTTQTSEDKTIALTKKILAKL